MEGTHIWRAHARASRARMEALASRQLRRPHGQWRCVHAALIGARSADTAAVCAPRQQCVPMHGPCPALRARALPFSRWAARALAE